MRKILCIMAVLLSLTGGQAFAQRYLPGQKGIQVTGGLADNFQLKSTDGFGYHAGIAVATYMKNGNRWVVGGEYLEKRYEYRDDLYPVSQFTGEGGYYMNFLSDRRKTFFLSLGVSALAGYETVNWGTPELPDGSRLTNGDDFIYGGALTLELETYITDRVVFLINARQRGLWGGDCGRFHSQIGIGLKLMIN